MGGDPGRNTLHQGRDLRVLPHHLRYRGDYARPRRSHDLQSRRQLRHEARIHGRMEDRRDGPQDLRHGVMSLSFDPDRISLPIGHFIGDRLLESPGLLPMRRPSDGASYAECPIASEEVVDEAVQIARKALKTSNWGGVRPRERANVLRRWADLIESEAKTLAKLEAVSSTRPVGQLVAGDIAVTAEQIRFFAEFADKEGSDLVPTDDKHLGMIMTEPFGVVGAITPWNFPVSMAGWKLGPALAAGNAVVLKPSEMTPFSSVFLAQLAVQAGLPAGLVNVVLGDGRTTGTAMTGHPDVAKVSFTGSTGAGAAIMANVARTGIKPM